MEARRWLTKESEQKEGGLPKWKICPARWNRQLEESLDRNQRKEPLESILITTERTGFSLWCIKIWCQKVQRTVVNPPYILILDSKHNILLSYHISIQQYLTFFIHFKVSYRNQLRCTELYPPPPPNPYVEASTPNMTIFRDGTFGK